MGNTDKLANPVMELKSTTKSLQRRANMDGARLHFENTNRQRAEQERSTDSIMNPQPGTYVAAGSWSTTSSAQESEHNFTIIGAAAHRKDPLIFYTMNPKSRTYIASGSSVITSLTPWLEHNFTGSAVAVSAKMNAKLGANGDPNFIGMAAASIKMNAKVVLEKSNEHLLSMGEDGGFPFV